MENIYPRGHVVFCDDIRSEVGGKPSFMGVYLGHLIVLQEFPVTISKLCMFVTVIEKIDAPSLKRIIKVHLPGDPDDKPTGTIEMPAMALPLEIIKNPIGKDPTRRVTNASVVFSPVTLKERGEIVVTARFGDDGDDSLVLGKLLVYHDSNIAAQFGIPLAPTTAPLSP